MPLLSTRTPARRAFGIFPKRLGLTQRRIREAEGRYAQLPDSKFSMIADDLRDAFEASSGNRQASEQFGGLIAAAVRATHGFQLHDVQIQAIAAGHPGEILEMQTGEGKTVVAGVIAAMQTLTSPAVHVSTTNTYLAARDLDDMRPVFELLGISCGLLPEESNEAESRRAYRNQIVYGPGYQFGFDYLRDQMFLRKERPDGLGHRTAGKISGRNPQQNLVQSGVFHTALVDEADSVMIDEATTPLIISLPSNERDDPKPYLLAKTITDSFEEGRDYSIRMPGHRILIHDGANDRGHAAISEERNLDLARPWRVYLKNAVTAKLRFHRDVDYVVVEGQVQIVDQYTGRIQPDRKWQDGLHQAVEAKEGVVIEPGRESTAQVTRQRFLQRYDGLIGLTGTAATGADEFRSAYSCSVKPIPTNRPCVRRQIRTRFFANLDAKLAAIAEDVQRRHATGQPILVGTKTIQESYQVRDALEARGLKPLVLNGVQDEAEADIVAQAGEFGALTIATNMAGRGTDIKPDDKALAAGGLHVVGVSPNMSTRIDRQLAGRAARQGQPGSCQFFASADDTVFEENSTSLSKSMRRRANRAGESPNYTRHLLQLQREVEIRDRKQREAMMLRDRWMDSVRESIEKD